MEMWKAIKDYEGLYEVSNFGRVRALARTIINKNGLLQRYPEKFLKFDIADAGSSKYHRATLSKDHITKKYSVHRLVAENFISNPENKPHVNHLDNDGTNNHWSNLEWCTHSENMIHAQKQGRLFTAQSSGGKVGSRQEVAAAIAKAESTVGNTYNMWKVLYSLGKQGKGKGKYYMQCMCVGCSREYRIEVGRLIRLEATSCKSCSRAR